MTRSPHSNRGVNDELNATAAQLHAVAADLERTAADIHRLASTLQAAEPVKPLPAVMTIPDAAEHFGFSKWGVRKLLEEGVLEEVRIGTARRVTTASLAHLTGAA